VPSVIYKGKAHPYRENQIPTLSDAESKGQFVRVRCTPCKITRYFRPTDIEKLLQENLHVLNLQRKFRCDRCGSKDHMVVEFRTLVAAEMVGLVVRELVDVKTVRRPVWRDRRM
jgi:hypothetical protein